MNRDKLFMALAVLLFFSLTANVFVGAMLAGQAYNFTGREEHHGDWKKKEAALRAALSAADQMALSAATKGKHEQFHTMHDALEVARQRIEAAEDQEPFDPKALDAALSDELQKKSALLKLIRHTHEDITRRLSPAGREIFVKIVRETPEDAAQQGGRPPQADHRAASPAAPSASAKKSTTAEDTDE